MTIQINSVNFSADSKLKAYIDSKLGKLDKFYDRIQGVEVFLKLESHKQVKEKAVEVRIDVPGSAIYVSEKSTTFEASADTAYDTLKRQLKRYKEKLRK